MHRLQYLLAILVFLLLQTPVLAENIYDCADGGGKVCSDSDIPAAAPTDWSFPTAQDECNSICSDLADSIEGGLSNVWVCTATSASWNGYSTDPHGNQSTLCTCDVTCAKGVTPRKTSHHVLPRDN